MPYFKCKWVAYITCIFPLHFRNIEDKFWDTNILCRKIPISILWSEYFGFIFYREALSTTEERNLPNRKPSIPLPQDFWELHIIFFMMQHVASIYFIFLRFKFIHSRTEALVSFCLCMECPPNPTWCVGGILSIAEHFFFPWKWFVIASLVTTQLILKFFKICLLILEKQIIFT